MPRNNTIQDAFVINLNERTDKLEDFNKQKFPFPVKRFSAYKNTNGWLGCAKSHVEVLRCNYAKIPFIVFEDDALLIQDWSIVEKAMEQLPENWDMLFLGASLNNPVKKYSENLFHLHSAWTTHAIIYGSIRVIEDICQNVLASGRAIDFFYKKFIFPNYNCFVTNPIVMVQKAYISDITGKMSDVSKQLLANFKEYTK